MRARLIARVRQGTILAKSRPACCHARVPAKVASCPVCPSCVGGPWAERGQFWGAAVGTELVPRWLVELVAV